MNPKLLEAVEICKELGWEKVAIDNIMDLPLGTAEQKKTALDGLKSGDWGEFALIEKNTYGWKSYVDIDQSILALYVVRLGAAAQRTANILNRAANHEMLIAVLAERGAKYAADFIHYACTSRRRTWEHSASVFGSVAVRLVDKLDLDIPQNVEYLKDWAVYAAAAMGIKSEVGYGETDFPSIDLIKKRFIAHTEVAVALNLPATGPFGEVFPAGVKLGWLSRERAMKLIFFALDASVRPGDRKVWLNVLDEIKISDGELCEHVQAFIPLLALGDSFVITRLAPTLIANAADGLLTEVLTAAFSGTTKKVKQLVLKAALAQKCPANVAEITPWLLVFACDADKHISSLGRKLMDKWNIQAELSEEEEAIQGLWQDTPPVWQVPAFALGEISPEALTDLAARLVGQAAVIHDVTTERFLAVANAVAYKDVAAARISLQGLRSDRQPLNLVSSWVKKENLQYGLDEKKYIRDLLMARDCVVTIHLGKLPCLLSTPSVDDLSITVPDLTTRLKLYKETGTDVLEADLFLALTRLNITTATDEEIKALGKLDVPIVLQSGEKMPAAAGQMVLDYLKDPIKEPIFAIDNYGHWQRNEITLPASMHGFPDRFSRYVTEKFSLFPLWGDAALTDVRWDEEVYHELGLVLRQVVTRATPLPKGAAINLLAAQRSMTADAAEDAMLAVSEAWARGLLRPGVANVNWLDWSPLPPPSHLAALVTALESIARDQLLSVVWPVLDELILVSLNTPRLAAGTAEVAQLIEILLPEVQHAVGNGKADRIALDLPGVRQLAQRGGSSKAVGIAQNMVNSLPAVSVAPKENTEAELDMNPPFDEVWVASKEELAEIDDGITFTISMTEVSVTKKYFLFTLALPDVSDRVFQVVKDGWYYDLENEGQCQAYSAAPGTETYTGNKENQVWLHWDTEQKKMVVCAHRNWIKGNDGPLNAAKCPPLSKSLLTLMIALLAQDGSATYYVPDMVRQYIASGKIGVGTIRNATKILLQSPIVSPAKLVRILEDDKKMLPVLWPILTESIGFAGIVVADGSAPPVWVNRILDNALRYAPYIKEAIKRGLIPAEDAEWSGLSQIASSRSKSAAVGKAKKLLTALL